MAVRSKINGQMLVNLLYYTCLPRVYREEDEKQYYTDKFGTRRNRPLYRYLQALIEGGAGLQLDSTNGLLDLVNPMTCPEEFFPALYESVGLEYYPDIDIKYHRRFLSSYGELKKRRGTYNSIRYVIKILTKMGIGDEKRLADDDPAVVEEMKDPRNWQVFLEYIRGQYKTAKGRLLIVKLNVENIEEVLRLDVNVRVIRDFLKKYFVPYYITVVFDTNTVPQDIKMGVYDPVRFNPEKGFKTNYGYATGLAMSVANKYRIRQWRRDYDFHINRSIGEVATVSNSYIIEGPKEIVRNYDIHGVNYEARGVVTRNDYIVEKGSD